MAESGVNTHWWESGRRRVRELCARELKTGEALLLDYAPGAVAQAAALPESGTLILTAPMLGAGRVRLKPLIAELRAAGLEPMFTGFFGALILPLWPLARRYTATQTPAWLSALLGLLLTLELPLVKYVTLPFGAALIIVARKA